MCIRDRNQGNECKFIVLSGYADFKFAQKAIQLGSVDYLLKPVTKKTLREVLERVEQKIREEKYQIRPSTFSEQELWERLYSVCLLYTSFLYFSTIFKLIYFITNRC